jgi:CHASE3 domain sensor protein
MKKPSWASRADLQTLLREAEELTRLTSQVSGPADAPPDAATTASFVDDWVARGKRALQRAVDIASGGSVKAAKDIARKAVSRLREGARSLLSTAQGAASEGLKTFAAAATWAGIAMTGGIIALSILAAVVAWKLSQSKSKR